MKQYISEEQLEELSKEAKQEYADWCYEHGYRTIVEETDDGVEYDVELMNIGMEIEFLAEKGAWKYWYKTALENPEQACDRLWEACKKVLEEQASHE